MGLFLYLASMSLRQRIHTKICILGGGPAGSTASLYLSKYKIPHLLIDRNNFPRDKVCGENFDGRVYWILKDLMPEEFKVLDENERLLKTWKYRIWSKNLNFSFEFPKEKTPRLALKRQSLDQTLFQKASSSKYAQIITGKTYTLNHTQEGHHLKFEDLDIQADFLIRATGARKEESKPHLNYLFSRTYYQGVKSKGEDGFEFFHFKKPFRGLVSLCPLPNDLTNVEITIRHADYQCYSEPLDTLLENLIEAQPELKARFKGAVQVSKPKGISMHMASPVRFTGDREVRIGSSAFTSNPAVGLGVGNAMSGGRLIARVINDLMGQPNGLAKVPSAYEGQAKTYFRPMLRFNMVANMIHQNFNFFEPLLWVFYKLRVLNFFLKQDLKLFSVRQSLAGFWTKPPVEKIKKAEAKTPAFQS